MSWVWEHGPSRQAECFVLLALADFCNDAGECWPSINGLARKTRLSTRGVQKILRALEVEGWISTAAGGGKSGCNQYRLSLTPPERCSPPEQRSPRTTFTTPPNVVRQTPERGSPEPSITIIEPSRKKESARDALAAVVGDELAAAFLDHRRALRSPMTPHAGHLMAHRLAAMADPSKAISTAIERGWKGVFEDENVTPLRKRQSDAERLDDNLDHLKARLAVQRLE